MKTLTLAFASLIAATTLAHAGSAEKRCWSKVTEQAEMNGCQFGNDFAPNARRCEDFRRKAYRHCMLRAQSIQRIGPVNSVPINRSTNLRYK